MSKFGSLFESTTTPDVAKVQKRMNSWLGIKTWANETKGWSVKVTASGSVKGSDQVLGHTDQLAKRIEVGLVNRGKYLGDQEVIDTFLHEVAHVMAAEPGHGFVFKCQYSITKSKLPNLLSEVSGGW